MSNCLSNWLHQYALLQLNTEQRFWKCWLDREMPLHPRLNVQTLMILMWNCCVLQILPTVDWVPRRGLCGAEGCVENLARTLFGMFPLYARCQKCQITYGQVSDYYFLKILIAFHSEVKISLLQASWIHLLPFEHFFASSVTSGGAQGRFIDSYYSKLGQSYLFLFFKLPCCSHENMHG